MQPLVLIAANPYEGELCRRALRDTGIEVELIESIEGAMRRIGERAPLCVVIADGWVHADARELLVEVRSEHEKIPIFLVEPRDSDIADEATAVRRGATRLFLRPIDPESLADALEKLAVEAELAAEVGAQLDGAQAQPAGGALIERAIELVAEESRGLSGEWPPLKLPRVITEVVGPPKEPSLGDAPPSAALPRPITSEVTPPLGLLRADDALAGDFVLKVEARAESQKERSGFARRLDRELSEAEKRLFPDSQVSSPAYPDEDDALGDIDLDRIGLDTMPSLSLDADERAPESRKNGNGSARLEPVRPSTIEHIEPAAAPIREEGSLDDEDVAELLFSLHEMGWTGRVALQRGEAHKAIFFDAGAPVFATSSLLHDRLGDLLWREGKLTREQHARTRELTTPPGRRIAQALVDAGMLKSGEVFPTLRRQVEEIVWSCFSWDAGTFRLTAEAPSSEDRLRLSQPPRALFLEGIRRKYGLERLVERVGPTDTVLVPTTMLMELRSDGGLSASEEVALDLFDGDRSLGDLLLALAGVPGVELGETALYALAWGLLCAGAVRRADDPTDRLGIPSVATLVTPGVERRTAPRAGERDGDRSIDRGRVAAKRAQLADCDYFGALGLDRAATPHEIERAWDRLRHDFAPERFSEAMRDELADALGEIRTVLDEAHRILMDDRVREAYRSHLAE